jgi:GTPase
LTTQLLWRLQQSSPYHASSTKDLVLPKLPEATESLQSPATLAKLLPGLEESRGALYEIGVSDDGTFVGLTKEEMDESLTNLRAMSASLGCTVKVIRMVVVGDCEWYEPTDLINSSINAPHQEKVDSRETKQSGGRTELNRRQAPLYVTEALVTPDLTSRKIAEKDFNLSTHHTDTPLEVIEQDTTTETSQQLRITLTGPTTSGKSSLLGTLSTATLDNGRGKSRLSLLKHRHEIASGLTSSLAQELIGYKNRDVINYASGNVTSWTDIHSSSQDGRLVFFSDSAGHPRYRRTTVRGLIGWAPHYTVLCIAADDGDDSSEGPGRTASAQEILGTAGAGVDLAKAHLELCLKLDAPLVIVITKLDLASKNSLRQMLSKLLSAIKATGRTPSIVPPDQTKNVYESDLTTILQNDETAVQAIVSKMVGLGMVSVVPILMTSAAKGTGIRSLHALLQNLPIPPAPTVQDFIGLALNPEQPSNLFHIEDVFGFPASYEPLASVTSQQTDSGVVVAGHLRFGRLSIGDIVVIGPFPAGGDESDSLFSRQETRASPSSFGEGLPHSSSIELSRIANRKSSSVMKGEWHNAHVVSLRNLRLPVHTLGAGQVGTVGIVFDIPEEEISNGPFERPLPTAPRIRKGMVLAMPSRHMIQSGHTLQAASGFTASFEDGDINSVTAGSLVVVYIASIRASARVVRLVPQTNKRLNELEAAEDDGNDVFGVNERIENEETEPLIFGSDGVTDVTFELITNREWIELGSQVLVMPGGGHGLYHGSERGEKGVAGLEGFVGKVLEVVD